MPDAHRRRPRRFRGLALAALLSVAATGSTLADYDRYHDYDQLTDALRELAAAHRSTATLVSIGESHEGRDVWAVEIAAAGELEPDQRPGILVVGNLEAQRVIGSELSLFLVEDLLTRAETDEDVRDLLAEHTFYVVPRVNPDGAEAMFARVKSGMGLNSRPTDADTDGRMDEDGPEDLNGDGIITLMRVPEAGGPYVLDPEDDRLLRPADPSQGEGGAFQVYVEGVDSDGDGFFNEDGPGGVDLNRNFQHAYPYYAPDAGPHMVSEPESRALMDFVLAHRNIAAILTFGASDNLVGDLGPGGEAPEASPLALQTFPDAHVDDARSVGMMARPSRGGFFGFGGGGQQGRATGSASSGPSREPATTVDTADREYYGTIAERYRELTGIETLSATRAPEGAFHDYGYFQFGVPSFSTPGWGVDAAGEEDDEDAGGRPGAGRGTPADGAGAVVLAWLDREGIDGFVAWTSYEHPELGPVEIGGFHPYAVTNPPAERIAELGSAHTEFALYLAGLLPRVRIAETDVTSHGGGLFEVTATVENTGYLPTALAHGVTARAVAPTMVQLDIDPDALVTGDAKTAYIPALDGSGSRRTFTWMVRGQRGQDVELRVVAQKAGRTSTTVTLR